MNGPDSAAGGRLRALMDASVDAIVLIDIDGRVQDLNQAALKMFGYPPERLCGQNVSFLMPEPFRSEHDSYIQRYLSTGQARIIGLGREVIAQRADGSQFPIDLAVGAVREDSQIIGFAGFIRDLTERKAVESRLRTREQELAEHRERLMHASRLGTMGEMAAGIAHEMNQPLTAIASYAHACQRLLDQGAGSAEILRETLDKIAVQAERAGEVIRGLRRFTRKQSLPRQPVELKALLLELKPLLLMDSRASHFELALKLPDRVAVVDGDPVQLQQVLLNLVRNAADALAGADDGRVEIRLWGQGSQWWTLEVEDNGPGLESAVRDELFHPFVTSKPDGVGLGLSICRSIADAHGGELSCISSQAGQTVFRLILPAAERAN